MFALRSEATCRLGKKAATHRRTPNLLWAGPISAPQDRRSPDRPFRRFGNSEGFCKRAAAPCSSRFEHCSGGGSTAPSADAKEVSASPTLFYHRAPNAFGARSTFTGHANRELHLSGARN